MNDTKQPRPRQAAPIHSKNRGVSVWHPENLDVDGLFESYGQRVAEGVLWLGDRVYVGLCDDARCRDAGRVPLRADYLRAIVGRHHLDAVREAASAIGYVERNGSYSVGRHSQSYWIMPPYDRASLVQRRIGDCQLRQNIREWLESRHREAWERIRSNKTLVDPKVCEHLWRNLQRIRIDRKIDFGADFHPAHQIAVDHILTGNFRFFVDDYGRCHTNLTNLSKKLRKHLSVDGKRLENVDISESQPLFIGMLIAQNIQKQKKGRGKEKGKQGEKGGNHPICWTTIMLDNNYVGQKAPNWGGGFDRRRLPADLRLYLELCESRALYQTVADRLGKTRDEAKQAIMVSLFDKPCHQNTVSQVLGELFPTVMQSLQAIKRPDYRLLAHRAQETESMFMFGRVVPRITKSYPSLFISTIHDSILTTEENATLVQKVMLDEFAKLGLSPQVKVEAC